MATTGGRNAKVRTRAVIGCAAALAGMLGCGPLESDETDAINRTESALALAPGVNKWTMANSGKVVSSCWMRAGEQPPLRASPEDWNLEKSIMMGAVAKTWGRVANIRFTWSTSTCPTTGTVKYVRLSLLGKTAGGDTDGFGWSGGTARPPWGVDSLKPPVPWNFANPTSGDSINFVLRADGVAETSRARMEYLAAHEYGHALGFLHEQDRDDSLGHCANLAQTNANAAKITTYDQQSIMNYCGPNSVALTALDVVGARKMYGYRNAGDIVVNDQWRDLLWHNRTSGEVVHWGMFKHTPLAASTQGSIGSADPAWKVIGTGDFNNDGESDLVWHNRTAGMASLWLLRGKTILSFPPAVRERGHVGLVPARGGRLRWRRQPRHRLGTPVVGRLARIWLMKDGVALSSPPAFVTGRTSWRIVGAGDFNGDGKEIVGWHSTSGGTKVEISYMNGASVTGWSTAFTNIGEGWLIQAVGDYNGDYYPDFVWTHTPSGQRSIWYMTSANVIKSFSPIFTTIANDWDIVGP